MLFLHFGSVNFFIINIPLLVYVFAKRLLQLSALVVVVFSLSGLQKIVVSSAPLCYAIAFLT